MNRLEIKANSGAPILIEYAEYKREDLFNSYSLLGKELIRKHNKKINYIQWKGNPLENIIIAIIKQIIIKIRDNHNGNCGSNSNNEDDILTKLTIEYLEEHYEELKNKYDAEIRDEFFSIINTWGLFSNPLLTIDLFKKYGHYGKNMMFVYSKNINLTYSDLTGELKNLSYTLLNENPNFTYNQVLEYNPDVQNKYTQNINFSIEMNKDMHIYYYSLKSGRYSISDILKITSKYEHLISAFYNGQIDIKDNIKITNRFGDILTFNLEDADSYLYDIISRSNNLPFEFIKKNIDKLNPTELIKKQTAPHIISWIINNKIALCDIPYLSSLSRVDINQLYKILNESANKKNNLYTYINREGIYENPALYYSINFIGAGKVIDINNNSAEKIFDNNLIYDDYIFNKEYNKDVEERHGIIKTVLAKQHKVFNSHVLKEVCKYIEYF